MTILPKKKTGGGKSEGETDHGGGGYQISNQANEELLWGEPHHPSPSSPAHWSPGPSREEKRHSSSPIHPADFEDSLDGAPTAKRARQVGRHTRARSKPYVPQASCSARVESPVPEDDTGYNSEDEYSHVGATLSEEEWIEKDRRFDRVIRRKGYTINSMGEDGACLFRAVADQLYGDQEMHRCVRSQCMDYVESNRDYFEQYVTEDFIEYVRRKRLISCHGNHLEIQALSELYNRPIHIYCYSAEPINIFQNISRSSSELQIPIRLSYHRGVHYNSVNDPNSPAIGLGLGLPGVKPGCNNADLRAMLAQNDNILTEQQMLNDKVNFTDWEATNEVIEEQVARESYMLWLQEQEKQRNKANRNPPAATVTSGQMSPRTSGGGSSPRHLGAGGGSSPRHLGGASPRPLGSPRPRPQGQTSPRPQGHTSPRPCSGHSSPKAGCSHQVDSESPKPGSSKGAAPQSFVDHGLGPGFHLRETATFLNGLPPDVFGLDEWGGEDTVLNQVLAESQQEYFNSLKRQSHSDKEKE